MGIKSIFSMLKADRYTQDGRDKLAEDKTYQTGQISEKTGLQKQPDGSWKPPKSNASKSSLGGEAESQSLRAAAKAVGEVNKAKTIKQKTEILEDYGWNSDDGGQTWTNTINGVNQKIKADMQTGEFKLVKPAGSENKPAEKKPDGADRHDQMGGEIKGNLEAAKYYFDKAQSFSTTDPSYKTYMGKAKEYNDKAKAQADDYGFDFEEMHNSGVTRAVNKYTEEQSKPAENTKIQNGDLLEQAEKIYVQTEEDIANPNLSREEWMKVKGKQQDSYRLRELLEFGVDKDGKPKNERVANEIKTLTQNLGLTARDHAPLTGDTKIKVRRK